MPSITRGCFSSTDPAKQRLARSPLSLRACSKPGSEGIRETSGRIASRKSCTGKGREDCDSLREARVIPQSRSPADESAPHKAPARFGGSHCFEPVSHVRLKEASKQASRTWKMPPDGMPRAWCRLPTVGISPIRALARQSPPGVHCTPRPARSAHSDHRDFPATLVIAGLQGPLVTSYQDGHSRETLLREERANIPREEEGRPVVMNMETRRDACLSSTSMSVCCGTRERKISGESSSHFLWMGKTMGSIAAETSATPKDFQCFLSVKLYANNNVFTTSLAYDYSLRRSRLINLIPLP